MQVPTMSHVGMTGVAASGVSGAVGVSWKICLAALLISIMFALLRFIPRAER